MIHLDKINSKKRNRLTFLLYETQNKMLYILGQQVCAYILNNLENVGFFKHYRYNNERFKH